eukprot:3206080-Rhodomonas_salina.2
MSPLLIKPEAPRRPTRILVPPSAGPSRASERMTWGMSGLRTPTGMVLPRSVLSMVIESASLS